jgi:hypothetical protein
VIAGLVCKEGRGLMKKWARRWGFSKQHAGRQEAQAAAGAADCRRRRRCGARRRTWPCRMRLAKSLSRLSKGYFPNSIVYRITPADLLCTCGGRKRGGKVGPGFSSLAFGVLGEPERDQAFPKALPTTAAAGPLPCWAPQAPCVRRPCAASVPRAPYRLTRCLRAWHRTWWTRR